MDTMIDVLRACVKLGWRGADELHRARMKRAMREHGIWFHAAVGWTTLPAHRHQYKLPA